MSANEDEGGTGTLESLQGSLANGLLPNDEENQNEEATNEEEEGGAGTLESLQGSLANGLLPNEEENQNEEATNEEEAKNEEENQNEEAKNEEETNNEEAKNEEKDKQSQRSSQQSRQSKKSQVHEPSSQNSTRRSSSRGRSTSSTTRNSKKKGYDMSEVTALSTAIYQGQPITTKDPDLIAAAILDLQDMRYQLECEGKFDEAIRAVQAIDRAREEQKVIIKEIYSNEEVEEVNQKIQTSKKQLSKLNKKAEIRTNQLNYELDELIENLKKEQAKEIEEHEKEWKSDAKMRDYNRTSAKVRALRYQQQKMLNSKRYAEAEQVKRIADNIVASEAISASKQMENEYKASLELLLNKHQKEMDNLLISNAARRAELQHVIEKRKAPIILRISQLENEENLAKDQDRVWNLRYKNDSASISKRMGMTADANTQSARLRIADYNKMTLPPLKTDSLKRTVMSKRGSRM